MLYGHPGVWLTDGKLATQTCGAVAGNPGTPGRRSPPARTNSAPNSG
jgi:hypothetical protein